MNTKKQQIISFLILFLCLIGGRINAQEFIKAEKEWLIDYYFKDDTAFNSKLTKFTYFIQQNKFEDARLLYRTIKFDINDTLQNLCQSICRIKLCLLESDKNRAYVICDSTIKLLAKSKSSYERYYIDLEKEKLKISTDSIYLVSKTREREIINQYVYLIKYSCKIKYYFGLVKIIIDYNRLMMALRIDEFDSKLQLMNLRLAETIKSKTLQSWICDEMFYYYNFKYDIYKINDFKIKAYKYKYKEYKLNEEINYLPGLLLSDMMYSLLAYDSGDIDLALKYSSKILLRFSKEKNYSKLAIFSSLHAKILFKAKRILEAKKMDEIALNLSENFGSDLLKITCANNYYRNILFSCDTLDISQLDKLKKYFIESENFLKKNAQASTYMEVRAETLINFSRYLVLIGNVKASLDTALVVDKIPSAPFYGNDLKMITLNVIYSDYKKLGDYKNALVYKEKFDSYLDSVNKSIQIQMLIKNDVDYEFEKVKRQERDYAIKEKSSFLYNDIRKKNILKIAYSSIIGLCFIGLFFTYQYRQKSKSEKLLSHLNNELYTKNIEIQNTLEYSHKMEKQIMLQKIESQNKESEFQLAQAELKALRSQMNPHFLFNAINSIQSYMLKNDSLLASKYLTKFARLIRSVLENSKQEFVLLSTEISTLELYVELEAMRSSFEFDYEFVLEDGMVSSDYLIPPMIIQPYVENAILHGITQLTDRRGNLIISFSIENQILKCIVDDNGIGRKEAMKIKAAKDVNRKSIGLEVTNNRIDILNKHNKMFAQVNIIDKFDNNNNALGTRVEIEITLNKAV